MLYTGHAVAAVCAVSPHIAEEALDLIEVEYKVLEPVVDIREAMRDDAPLLDEERTTRALGEDTGKKSNIATHNQHAMGDLAAGFAEADVIVEREFHTATIHQGYIEPHNTTVWWKNDGSVTVWVSTQGPFEIRSQGVGSAQRAGLQGQGYPLRNRRRLRRQVPHLYGASRGHYVAQNRPAGQNDH